MGKDRLPLHFALGESFVFFHLIHDDDEDDSGDDDPVDPMDMHPEDLPPEIDPVLSENDSESGDDLFDFDELLYSANFEQAAAQPAPNQQSTPAGPGDIPNNSPDFMDEELAGPSTDADPVPGQGTAVAAFHTAAVGLLAELRTVLAALQINLDAADTQLTTMENNLDPPSN